MFGSKNYNNFTAFIVIKTMNSQLFIEYIRMLEVENDRLQLNGKKAACDTNSVAEELLWSMIKEGIDINIDFLLELDFHGISITDINLIGSIINSPKPHYDINELAKRWDHRACSKVVMWTFVESYLTVLNTTRLCHFAVRAGGSQPKLMEKILDEITDRSDITEDHFKYLNNNKFVRQYFKDTGVIFVDPSEIPAEASDRELFTDAIVVDDGDDSPEQVVFVDDSNN